MDVIAIDRLQELENTSCLCMYDIHSCEHAGHVSETWIIISTWYFASHVVVWGPRWNIPFMQLKMQPAL